jgi:urease accessory protein
VGGFAYSHGLESAQEAGLVTTPQALKSWLITLLDEGSLHSDLTLMQAYFNAPTTLEETNALALALAPSKERLLEMSQQGASFVKMLNKAWGFALPETLCYPLAFATASHQKGFSHLETRLTYGFIFIQNQLSAALRLGIIGQTQGQEIVHALLPLLTQKIDQETNQETDQDFGTACFMADFLSLKHETQFTRIFRS